MSGLIVFLAAFAALAIIGVLAQTHGVDSRDESQDPRAPRHGISI